MKKEEVIKKIMENIQKKDVFILSEGSIHYKMRKQNVKAERASLLLEVGDCKYSIGIGMGTEDEEKRMSDSDIQKIMIIPLSKHRVAVYEKKENSKWFLGGFNSDNDNMKILGYMEFGVFNVLIYFNSETDTPFIRLEDWENSLNLKFLYQAFYSLLFDRKEGDVDEFEEL